MVKLGSHTCTCHKWQMTGLPCFHVLAVIVKANRWVYDFVHPMHKEKPQRHIYNQLVHPMETHHVAVVDDRTGRVVGDNELDVDYSHCILPPFNNNLDDLHQNPGSPKRNVFHLLSSTFVGPYYCCCTILHSTVRCHGEPNEVPGKPHVVRRRSHFVWLRDVVAVNLHNPHHFHLLSI